MELTLDSDRARRGTIAGRTRRQRRNWREKSERERERSSERTSELSGLLICEQLRWIYLSTVAHMHSSWFYAQLSEGLNHFK